MLYDISQPVFRCKIFPGDPKPQGNLVRSMEKGDLYNLSFFSMCAHNGTHVDAPFHFLKDGKGIGNVSLEKFIGRACVISHEGTVSASDAKQMLRTAAELSGDAARRILIRGKATVSLEAAKVFAKEGVWLLGNESQTVGPEDAPMAVHRVLLEAETVLLEGIRLSHVPDGIYLLHCAPLNLEDADGAPCRATLAEL